MTVDTAAETHVPEVSVIIACHNATKTLPLQLEALSRQEGAPAFEVILSDNRSDDNLVALRDTWSECLDVEYVWSGQVLGAAYARNVGMSIARADKWLFCDADDVVARDWVAQGAATLSTVPVFSGGAVHADDDDLSTSLERIWDRFLRVPNNRPVVVAKQAARWPIIMGGNFGIRRLTALGIGGFDASLERGVEDNDLAVRLEDEGFFVSEGNTSRIVYRRSTDCSTVFERSFISGKWHMELVERHGLAARSPLLRHRGWMADPLRVVGAAVKNATRGRDGDWAAVWARAGVAVGLWSGWMTHRKGRGQLTPLVGAGLGGREPVVPDGAAVLVLSPHLDDAMFSCSELIRRTRPDVWTVFAGEPETPVTTSWDLSCGYGDSHALVAQRRQEDQEAFAGTGASIRHLDMLDGVYTSVSRRAADLESLAVEVDRWLSAHQNDWPVIVLPACAGVVVKPGMMDRMMSLLTALPRRGSRPPESPENPSVETRVGTSSTSTEPSSGLITQGAIELLRKLKHSLYQRRRARAQRSGFAVNGDHLAVRDTILNVVSQRGQAVQVLLAEDLPYLWSQTGDEEVARLADRLGILAEPHEWHVDREWKYARLAHYVSQLQVMDPGAHRLSRSTTVPSVERCWELNLHTHELN